jgi:hypothetical protein
MQEPSGRTFGLWLGLCTVVIGFFFMGIGLAAVIVGRRSDGFDGLLTGALALGAGCVILNRRKTTAGSEKRAEND